MTMDFAVIPAEFNTREEALNACDAMYNEPEGEPPSAVLDMIAELDRTDAFAEEGGFLSMWPVDSSARGMVLCTRWPEWDRTIYTLLTMTKDRGLAMVDLQRRQVFDPRGRTDVEVLIANGTKLPYLSEQIVVDVMNDQDYYGDYIIAECAENTYVQALYKPGEQCQVEYRDGSPDRHFQTLTADRSLVPRLFAAWLHDGPTAGLLQAQQWQRLEF
ncbi:hypothetical protein AN916_22785 [Mycobacteroides immunogenum]|uniref:Uncharacterized protein n=1 Tax=Mycobacteroides immunogenum TaxID=83262 RepID=A0A7V8LKL4_9MYCO|nr:hypothetical protein TL11_22040 [Mycobacteroides immunogenum]KPG04808.1 hypothetical protein AN908_23510 [Mycobacteroides immunogenum]KPG47780.1 hypothetical protein AN916_22785 [Mycobacteroides immunogenum]